MGTMRVRGEDVELLCVPEGSTPQRLVVMMGGGGQELAGRLEAEFAQDIRAGRCPPFAYVGFPELDWNRDLTPWPAPGLRKGEEPFGGQGEDTLRLLTEELLPAVEAALPTPVEPENRMLLGYSLAGLFSLWAVLKGAAVGGCGCCSGSLWYDGWMDFLPEAKPRPVSRIYLSLGRREEKARNRRLAAVGEATRDTYAALEAHPDVAECALEWEDGGHFGQSAERLLRAIRWWMQAPSAQRG